MAATDPLFHLDLTVEWNSICDEVQRCYTDERQW